MKEKIIQNLFGDYDVVVPTSKLGINYMGSKRTIASDIIEVIYNTVGEFDNFYDLFGGGGAMSYAVAELTNAKVYYNELNKGVAELVRYLNNNKDLPKEWYEFVTRDMFFENYDKETAYGGFVKTVYSFGGSQTSYLYGESIEKLKQAAYEEAMSEGTFNKANKKRIKISQEAKAGLRDESLIQLENFTRIIHLRNIMNKGNVLADVTSGSYDDVAFKKEGTVIYCDIPYEDTGEYQMAGFNHRKFEEWFLEQEVPVFVSSYKFNKGKLIMEKKKSVLMQGGGGNTAVERLYWNGKHIIK